jgi:TatD DNase family protein
MLAEHRPTGAILHWFLGSAGDIDTAISLDLHFSINDHMATSATGKEVIELLPPNRVLLETDAPFGAKGGGAKPGQFDKTLRHLAKVWLRSIDSTRELIESNQRAFASRLTHVPPAVRAAIRVSEPPSMRKTKDRNSQGAG